MPGAASCLLLLPLAVQTAIPTPERLLTDPRSLESPAAPESAPVPIADLFYTHSHAGVAWSPDGKQIVMSTNFSGRFNLWKVDAAGGWPIQLVQSEDRQFGATWSPDGKWIVYASDRAGGEIFALYAVPSDGGPVQPLTADQNVTFEDAVFSPDGATIALNRKPKDASATDLALLDWKTHSIRQLTHEQTKDHLWQAGFWSADGRTLYANRLNAGFTDASVWRIDVATGKAEELTPHKGPALVLANSIAPDGSWLAVTSNARDGHDQAALYDVSKRSYRWITQGPWDAVGGIFAPDGKHLAYAVNADGRSDVFLYDIAGATSEKVAMPPGVNALVGNPTSFSADGTRLLITHQSSSEAADFWIYPLAGGAARQLSHSALASLRADALPRSQLVHYASFDGTVVSAFVWLPANLRRDASAPAVVLPHGGPTGQTLDTFNRTALALASRGYVCIAPNVRGSTGYGLPFQKANYQDLGGGDLQDEVFAAKFLVATGYVDAKKIGITGGSYGGYMALIAVGRTPETWAAAVDLFGVTNWLTEQAHEEPMLQQYDQTLLGDPVKDRAAYEKASATTYYANIRAPLLVLQGENDIRDPKEEAEQAFAALRAQGKVVDVHYYAGEGHGFAKRENQIDALERTVAWFDRYLKGKP